MMQLKHSEYDALERAIALGTRVAIRRKGRSESIVIPLKLRTQGRREVIEARNPTTGHDMKIYVDEIEQVEALP